MICPNQTDPDPLVAPWCQTEKESCSADFFFDSGTCTNKEKFELKGETFTCAQLEDLSSKKKENLCKRKKKVKKACPGVCNRRCTCTDQKTSFRIRPNGDNDFNGKFRCKNVNNDQQPSCDTKVKKGKLVKDYCPQKCGFCL